MEPKLVHRATTWDDKTSIKSLSLIRFADHGEERNNNKAGPQ